MSTIEQLLAWATGQLNESDSAALDSRLLLAHSLQCEPIFLRTWPEKHVSPQFATQFKQMLALRLQGHPIAYLLGYRDFWSLRLKVSSATLIPRPETELLVERALDLALADDAVVLDLGTGTGAIVLALASEQPTWQLSAIDQSADAVTLALENSLANNLPNVHIMQSDWFDSLGAKRFDLIVSNPPYVEDDSPYMSQGDVRFEPKRALVSGCDGLDDIRIIIEQSKDHLNKSGWLALEHGWEQGEKIRHLFATHKFSAIQTFRDLNGLERVSLAQYQMPLGVAPN